MTTIHLHAKEGLLGEGEIYHREIPFQEGLTARRVLAVAQEIPQLATRPLGVAVNGKLLKGRELDVQLPAGAEVIVASPQEGVVEVLYFIGELILYAIAGAALSYVVGLLIPPPRPRGVGQERGDASSSTYAWDGIATNYGQGLPIPYIGGRIAVGGQVISTELRTSSGVEVLFVVIALCEGPIHRVGDTIAGEQDNLGSGGPPVPAGILINGLTLFGNERAFIRSGQLNQSPLPSTFFPGIATTLLVNTPLESVGVEGQFPFEGTEAISLVRFIVAFPNGLILQTPSGTASGAANFEFYWRPAGAGAWIFLGSRSVTGASQNYIVLEHEAALPPGTLAPIELRVVRIPPSPPLPFGELIGGALWRQVVIITNEQFAYPGIALLGLQLLANSQTRGSLPQVQVPLDGDLVRVWDSTLGWSEPCWDVPAAPFNWMSNPPGRNPAWRAAKLLLDKSYGMGNYFREDQIDLEALRRWSILCDQEPNPGDPWGEAAFTCDFAADSPRGMWERLLAICTAGRCSPVPIGNKITFVYQYRDAHSDSLVSVPAKTPVQLFTSTNVQDFTIKWLERAGRPTVIQYQFLNENQNFAQDVVQVDDIEAAPSVFGEPDKSNPETVQSISVTRRSQLQREGVYTHRLRARTQFEVAFRVGTWALACRVGDLILVEHEVLRPFSTDVPMSCVIEADGVATSAMIVGHVVVGTSLRVVFRDPNGAPAEVAISSLTALPGGRTQLNLASPQTFLKGAPAVVGKVSKVTLECLVADISLEQDLRRTVRALQWVPSIFDPIGPDFFDDPPEEPAPFTADRSFLASVEAQSHGGHLISWVPDGHGRTGARVWVQVDGVDQWILLGDSRTGALETRSLMPHATYRLAVCFDHGRGAFPSPAADVAMTFTAPEFPRQLLPKVARLTIENAGTGLRFRWPAYGHTDLAYYELRVGATWATARPIYRGQLEEVVLDRPPAGTTFQVAVRSTSGLYGEPAVATAPGWTPPDKEAFVESDELVSTPSGSLTNLTYNATPKTLTLTAAQGEYEALELDGGFVAPWEWRVDHDYTVVDDLTCGEETGLCGDGEARWATCACRPPSPGIPGVSFDDILVGDDTGLCGDESPFEACGGSGELGDLAVARLESRVHDGSDWGDWQAHVDGVQTATQKLQVRVRTERQSDRVSVEINKLVTKGFL